MYRIFQWFVELFTNRNRIAHVIQCKYCKENHKIKVEPNDVEAWQGGAFIQDAMSYLTKGERELFISACCNDCWHKMFDFDVDFGQ